MTDSDNTTPELIKNPKNTRLPPATLKHPTIEAVLGDHFRFANKAQAQARLKAIRESFSASRLPKDEKPNPNELKLWIRGYSMSAESREAGYLGNFALLRVARAPEDKWTITATTLNIDKKYHPERRQTEQKFPNWGHPILRDVLKGRLHKTPDAAQNELKRLHEAFPEVTIPLANKIYIMIYGKAKEEGKPPVEKWVLEIKALETGEFQLMHAPNTHRSTKPPSPAAQENNAAAAPQESQGKFSAQVLLKRQKKKPGTSYAPKAQPDQGEG